MTFDDFKVIGIGSVALLILFLGIQAIRFDMWAIIRHYVVVRLADMSSEISGAGDFSTSARVGAGGAGDLVRGQQHQVNDGFDTENAPAPEPIILRQLPKTDLIVMLAVQRKEDGNYLWSANDITKFYPGADGPIKEIIATVRGKKPAEPAARSIRKGVSGEWEPVR